MDVRVIDVVDAGGGRDAGCCGVPSREVVGGFGRSTCVFLLDRWDGLEGITELRCLDCDIV